MVNNQVIIVGCGLAGLTVALELAEKTNVLILSKKDVFKSATAWAQGGIVKVANEKESIEAHINDTIAAGQGLVEKKVAKFVAESGHFAIEWLIKKGVLFSVNKDKEKTLHLVKEGGHSVARIAHAADATGKAILDALYEKAQKHPNISIKINWIAVDLVIETVLNDNHQKKCVVGIYALDTKKKFVHTLKSNAVVLATGGIGKVYRYTSNPDTATGDGIALAWRAGCRVSNMEFIQFHPTCLFHPKDRTFLISEALRGAGAKVELPTGEEFLHIYDSRAELAPRDIVARSIDFEMKKRGLEYVYLNAKKLGLKFLNNHFPNIKNRCLKLGIDISKQRIPVVPAAHYLCGGIKTDLNGKTDIENLYAIGETAYTGLHGANRLASNSLLECVVIGIMTAKKILKVKKTSNKSIRLWDQSKIKETDEKIEILNNWEELRLIMSNYVGIVRTDKRLNQALLRVNILSKEINEYYQNYQITRDLIEMRNVITCSELIIRSALLRRESIGLHYSKDTPKKSRHSKPSILTPKK